MNIRTYKEGDEKILSELCVSHYGKYLGSDQWTPDQWRSRYVLDPSIGPERILVAEKDDIEGYCAFATYGLFIHLPEKTGILYDLCLKKGRNFHSAGINLLKNCYLKLKKENITTINAVFSAREKQLKKLMLSCGFSMDQKKLTTGFTPTDYTLFLTRRIQQCKWFTKKYSVHFHLEQNFPKSLMTLGNDGKLDIKVSSEYSSKIIEVKAGLTDFTDIISGDSTTINKLIYKKISIKPFHAIPDLSRMLALISLKGYWFIPTLDWR